MECNTFEELLYSDLLIADSMEKNNLKEFPSEERKTLRPCNGRSALRRRPAAPQRTVLFPALWTH